MFRSVLGQSERTLVSELRETRNKWAHQKSFSSDDVYRALDSIERLLTAVSAPEANDVQKQKMEILRTRFDEQRRGEMRKTSIEGSPSAGLKPWRQIVTPHPDVASGKYRDAEFAADLWQVYHNQGSDEYKDPTEFFRRTYLTDGLKNLFTSPDGTIVKTLWVEIAWQLGGKEGYRLVERADETATNPGDLLQELFSRYSPCLVLIDEWVAYARQLHDEPDLPGGEGEGVPGTPPGKPGEEKPKEGEQEDKKPLLRRFHATVELDANRISRDAGQIADEVLQHLTKLESARVEVSLEIQTYIPNGVSEEVIRTVTENCRTLKFSNYDFEED